MALVTGKDCSLSVGAKTFDDAVNTFEIAFDQTSVEYQTLAGPKAGPGSETGTLSITFAYDADETDSLFQTLWAATEAGTPVAYVATVGGAELQLATLWLSVPTCLPLLVKSLRSAWSCPWMASQPWPPCPLAAKASK